MSATHARIQWIIEGRVFHTTTVKLVQPFLRGLPEVVEVAEFYGLGGTRLRTRWSKADFLPVIAKRAFKSSAVLLVSFDYPERARCYAISAAVADIRLNVDSAELGAYDGAGWASFQATGILAMFANVGGERP